MDNNSIDYHDADKTDPTKRIKPFVLCMTGISGSGKTTLSNAVAKILALGGKVCQVLDGDTLRSQIEGLFGYTREERMKQNRIVRVVAYYLQKNDISVLISIVAPYDAMRKKMRKVFQENYIQVYVRCPYEVCAERDVKGYYALQKKNQIQNLNGADEVYEVPEDSELIVDTQKEAVEESAWKIVEYLKEKGYVL